MFFSRYVEKRRLSYYAALLLLSVFTILMHEASFFYTFPILAFCTISWYNKNKNVLSYRSLYGMLLLWTAVAAAVVSICVFMADTGTVNGIWNSWKPLFVSYPVSEQLPELGEGVMFLLKDVREVAAFHFTNAWKCCFLWNIPSFPFNIYNFCCVYYLITRMNTVDMKFYKLKPFDKIQLSNIMIVQFVFLVPMFTVLSCDFGRTVPYWVISSLLVFHFFKDISIFPKALSRFSEKIQGCIDKSDVLRNPFTYLLLIVTMPLYSVSGSNISGILPYFYVNRVIKGLSLFIN